MNALYCDASGKILDFTDGYADVLKKRIRFVGTPSARIREDYLRILRFFRFHARYGKGAPDAGRSCRLRALSTRTQSSRPSASARKCSNCWWRPRGADARNHAKTGYFAGNFAAFARYFGVRTHGGDRWKNRLPPDAAAPACRCSQRSRPLAEGPCACPTPGIARARGDLAEHVPPTPELRGTRTAASCSMRSVSGAGAIGADRLGASRAPSADKAWRRSAALAGPLAGAGLPVKGCRSDRGRACARAGNRPESCGGLKTGGLPRDFKPGKR